MATRKTQAVVTSAQANTITSMADFMAEIKKLQKKYKKELVVVARPKEISIPIPIPVKTRNRAIEVPIKLTPGEKAYNKSREIFNTYFDVYPTAIIYCSLPEQVQQIMQLVARTTFNFLLRVRSGGHGHDHEGECTADNSIVLDLSNMKVDKIKGNAQALRTMLKAQKNKDQGPKEYVVPTKKNISDYIQIYPGNPDTPDDKYNGYAIISPGLPFDELIKVMDDHGVGIPHGTCNSVHLSGFVFGGGWGPWTRLKGMGCESLAGVKIVFGNGEVRDLIDYEMLPDYESDSKTVEMTGEDKQKLLWALRGGGGYGYGIITQVIMKTFKLPAQTTKFTVEWKDGLAMNVLARWEEIIMSKVGTDYNMDLLGTNIKIVGKPYDGGDINKSRHNMAFYGYYKSDNPHEDFKDLKKRITDIVDNEWFNTEDLKGYTIEFDNGEPQGAGLNQISWGRFAAWDRVINWEDNPVAEKATKKLKKVMNVAAPTPTPVGFIPPEVDGPAPHKISSRLVRSDNEGVGLGEKGRATLIRSLESDKINATGMANGLSCYVTLGAMSGYYYDKKYEPQEFPKGVAFPYSKCPYTIQYQVWWNQNGVINEAVNPYINDALAWIHDCRTMDFPETKGAFISFKDDSIPTETYFQESFDKLKEIKLTLCHDPRNIFSTKKTIL